MIFISEVDSRTLSIDYHQFLICSVNIRKELLRIHHLSHSINFFVIGEGKLTDKDGSIYEGSFHKHRRHGEGKWILRFDNANAYILNINPMTP